MTLTSAHWTETEIASGIPDRIGAESTKICGFLKALAHEGRLMILCHLVGGEKSVTELERLLGQRQAAVSQQLARLRIEGIVSHRREGKAIFYSLSDDKAGALIGLLDSLYSRGPHAS